jgi:uncharacterized membrane-anchored protein
MPNSALIAAIAGLIALAIVNAAIIQKESLLKEGEVVYLELAPVDPRSLMQGDYMALRFQIANEIRDRLRRQASTSAADESDAQSLGGHIVVVLDENRVARFARINNEQSLKMNERLMRFRIRDGRVKFATNAFFFQEGSADVYEQARYGEFRVANNGELLLTGMRDHDLKKLQAHTVGD